MSTQYLSEEANLADLEARIRPSEKNEYDSFRHLKIEAAFIGRVFILYRPQGLTKENTHRPPEVVCQVRVRGFQADAKRGCLVTVERMDTGEIQTLDHVPSRLFDLPLFASTPPFQRIRYDGMLRNGAVVRSMSFALLFKQRSRSDYYSAGCLMADTPNNFRNLYPHVDLNLLTA